MPGTGLRYRRTSRFRAERKYIALDTREAAGKRTARPGISRDRNAPERQFHPARIPHRYFEPHERRHFRERSLQLGPPVRSPRHRDLFLQPALASACRKHPPASSARLPHQQSRGEAQQLLRPAQQSPSRRPLCELGFVSNPQDNRYLQNATYRQRLAERIADGIVASRR